MKPALITLLLAFFCTTSCVEPIVMDTQESMPVIVYCVLTNQSAEQTLLLNAATTPSGQKSDVAAERIEVSSSSGEKLEFKKSEGAKWTAEFRPQSGETYSLRITLNEDRVLFAETSFPDSIVINDDYYEKWVLMKPDRFFDYRGFYDDEEHFMYTTRHFGFKLLEQEISHSSSNTLHDIRYPGPLPDFNVEIPEGKWVFVEKHPYRKSAILWITARSPKSPEELPFDDLFIPGHDYRSVFLATDMKYADAFNALPVHLGDLDCYSIDNVQYIEQAIADRDAELIPSVYNSWADEWYGARLHILDDLEGMSIYKDLSLHLGYLRIENPEGGYMNDISDPDLFYSESGDAYWWIDEDAHETEQSRKKLFSKPSPFTFQLFADFNLADPYSWQRTAHRLSSGWVVYEFHNVSREYDLFLKDVFQAGYQDVFGDLTQSLFNQKRVYSNIIGGVGIFGAECVTISRR